VSHPRRPNANACTQFADDAAVNLRREQLKQGRVHHRAGIPELELFREEGGTPDDHR
jgi:hypothetical protein